MRKCDEESAEYLAKAFEDAVKFFGYNVNAKGFRQFRSLDIYLSKVGNEKAFEAFRYWAVGESSQGESPIPYISPPIHRELLCALRCLFLPNLRETVSDRVESEVSRALFDRRHIHYSTDDTRGEYSVCWYINWLFREHSTRRSALGEAVLKNFTIKDHDEFVSKTLLDAYSDLQQSKDPAVRYYIRTLTYLPKGSQRRNPDAIPEVEWSSQDQTNGMVVTSAGTCLGFIDKYADGGWGITPQEEGLVWVTDIAMAKADAKHYLVNRLTRQVRVTVDGESRQLRVVSEQDFFPQSHPIWTPDIEDSGTYELEFWDSKHGLHPGEKISVELRSERGHPLAPVLKGTVIAVAEQKVSIAGMDAFTSTATVEC